MADDSAKTAEIRPVARNALGQVLPGSAPLTRNGGRPALPAWLSAKGEAALQYIADVADGTEFAEPELRLKAAALIVDRFYGKAREQVEMTGADGAPLVAKVVFELRDPPKQVIDVGPTRKALSDAE